MYLNCNRFTENNPNKNKFTILTGYIEALHGKPRRASTLKEYYIYIRSLIP